MAWSPIDPLPVIDTVFSPHTPQALGENTAIDCSPIKGSQFEFALTLSEASRREQIPPLSSNQSNGFKFVKFPKLRGKLAL
jgi:hypothetical protein